MLSKSFAGTPFFEMDIQLGTDDVLDAATPVLTRNAWKPQGPPITNSPTFNTFINEQQQQHAQQQQQSNDERSFMDDRSIANTLSSFRTEMTSVVTTMLEASRLERQEERKEYAESRRIENEQRDAAEKARAEQRTAQELKRKQERRDDIHRMEKLEKRREEQRVEEARQRKVQQEIDQRAHDIVLMNMMQTLIQGGSVPVGPLAATEDDVLVESIYGDNGMIITEAAIRPTAATEQDLVHSMQQAQLTSGITTKRHKSDTSMDTTANPTRTEDMRDVQHQDPVGNNPPLTGGQH